MNEPHPMANAAYARYEMRRTAPGQDREPAIPDEPGEVHAVTPRHPRLGGKAVTTVEFLEGFASGRTALCGRTVRILMPARFDNEDPDSCARCAEHYEAGTHAPRREPRDARVVEYIRTAAASRANNDHHTFVVNCLACGDEFPEQTHPDLDVASRAAHIHNTQQHFGEDSVKRY